MELEIISYQDVQLKLLRYAVFWCDPNKEQPENLKNAKNLQETFCHVYIFTSFSDLKETINELYPGENKDVIVILSGKIGYNNQSTLMEYKDRFARVIIFCFYVSQHKDWTNKMGIPLYGDFMAILTDLKYELLPKNTSDIPDQLPHSKSCKAMCYSDNDEITNFERSMTKNKKPFQEKIDFPFEFQSEIHFPQESPLPSALVDNEIMKKIEKFFDPTELKILSTNEKEILSKLSQSNANDSRSIRKLLKLLHDYIEYQQLKKDSTIAN